MAMVKSALLIFCSKSLIMFPFDKDPLRTTIVLLLALINLDTNNCISLTVTVNLCATMVSFTLKGLKRMTQKQREAFSSLMKFRSSCYETCPNKEIRPLHVPD